MGVEEHRRRAPRSVRVALLTVSDSRTRETDASGDLIESRLSAAGHRVGPREILPDDPDRVEAFIRSVLSGKDVDVLVMNGGTGLSSRDATFEALRGVLEKELPGFGELFRHLSYGEIGPAAMLSRATAGVARGKVVISLPGSTGAVELALEKLILPEIAHMVGEVRR